MPIQKTKNSDNIGHSWELKRNLASTQVFLSTKRVKKEATPWEGLTCIIDVVNLILTHLSARELLNFEQAAKVNSQLTRHAWKRLTLTTADCLQWEACENKPDTYKWNYALSMAIAEFFKIKAEPIPLRKKKMDRFSQKYGGLQIKFICFKIFIKLGQAFGRKKKPVKLSPCHAKQLQSIKQISSGENKWSGEALLAALWEAQLFYNSSAKKQTPAAKKKVHAAFESAINKGATCASLFMLNVPVFSEFQLALGLLSARIKDYRALTRLVQSMTTKELGNLKDAGHCMGPILAALAKTVQDLKAKDFLYAQALEDYADKAPFEVMTDAAETKSKLDQLEEAASLIDKALTKYGEQGPAEAFANAAMVKGRLGLWKEADAHFTRALILYSSPAPLLILASAAAAKGRLEQFEEADVIYAQVLTQIGTRAPPNIIASIAIIKCYLGQMEAADALFAQALVKYGDDAPPLVLHEAAKVKKALQQIEKLPQA